MFGKIGAAIGAHKTLAVVIAVVMMGSAVAGIVAWKTTSNVQITSTPATVSFTTTVNGVSTNASQTMLIINGNSYNETNIKSLTLTEIQTATQSSVLNVKIGQMLPGDYVQFNVTITNTGQATLMFGNYTMNDAAYNTTTEAFIAPSENVTGAMNGTNSSLVPVSTDTFSTNFGNLQGYTTTDFEAYLSGQTYWADNFGAYHTVIPQELKPGQSFEYTMFIGLGTNAPYPPTTSVFDLQIPLIPIR